MQTEDSGRLSAGNEVAFDFLRGSTYPPVWQCVYLLLTRNGRSLFTPPANPYRLSAPHFLSRPLAKLLLPAFFKRHTIHSSYGARLHPRWKLYERIEYNKDPLSEPRDLKTSPNHHRSLHTTIPTFKMAPQTSAVDSDNLFIPVATPSHFLYSKSTS